MLFMSCIFTNMLLWTVVICKTSNFGMRIAIGTIDHSVFAKQKNTVVRFNRKFLPGLSFDL